MKFNPKTILIPSTHFAVRVLLVVAIVLGLVWLLTQWAHQRSLPEPEPDGAITLLATGAQLHGPPQIKKETHAGEKNIGWWDHDTQWLSWKTRIEKPGDYRVSLRYARPGSSKVKLILHAGENTLHASTQGTGGWGNWKNTDLGTLHIDGSGEMKISLKATQASSKGIINFVHLKLVLVK